MIAELVRVKLLGDHDRCIQVDYRCLHQRDALLVVHDVQRFALET